MKLRIAIWAGVGALVVVAWTLYISRTSLSLPETAWVLAYVTCPIALAHHAPLSFDFVLLANAATYGLAGAVVETMRRRHTIPGLDRVASSWRNGGRLQ